MPRSSCPVQPRDSAGFTAVNNLSFDVPAGQIIGFLGPNGAGKSTSLRMALGVMAPDEGEVALFGAKPDIRNLRRVGFLPEERGLYKKMTARDTITYFARLKGMSAADAKARANELLETTGLGKFKATRGFPNCRRAWRRRSRSSRRWRTGRTSSSSTSLSPASTR